MCQFVSAFRTMTQDFPGVEIDVGGAADFMAKVDAKIGRIKGNRKGAREHGTESSK